MRLAVSFAFLALAACVAAPKLSGNMPAEAQVSPADDAFRAAPTISSFIAEGVALDGELYLRDDDNHLVALNLQKKTLRGIHAAGVVDIARDGDGLLVLRVLDPLPDWDAPRETWPKTMRYEVSRLHGVRQERVSAFTVDTRKEGDLHLFVSGGGPGLLSTASIRTWSAGRVHETAIAREGTFGASVIGAPRDGKSLYVGHNRGEWGGGLERIDIATGKAANIESIEDPGKICGYPLDADCDPVNAIIADPKRPDCVLAAVGLQHMMSEGRVLRVCGEKVEVAFEPKSPRRPPNPDGSITVDFSTLGGTEAVYGLEARGEDLWVITGQSIRRVGLSGAETVAMPRFEEIAGVSLSRDLPGMILLATTFNQRLSLSGSTPILVPLD